MKKAIFILVVVASLVIVALALRPKKEVKRIISHSPPTKTVILTPTKAPITSPLAIATMKAKSYPGSDLKIEQIMPSGSNYNQYLVSYQSDGLKIYGLLTVPQGIEPSGGWPVVLLNHGYIPPIQYSTETSYAAFVAPLATQGYIVFKPDYRGNGNSEGTPTQIYVSPDYVTDSMNALASIKKYKDANPNKIGVLAHSMGGNITLHELVMTKDIKAAVIASGVVSSYSDILVWWNKREATGVLTTANDLQTLALVKQFVKDHGTPQTNANFYNAIDPTNYLSDVTAPVSILVGTGDNEVPSAFSQSFRDDLQKAGKNVEYHEYSGADHNLHPDAPAALAQTLSFFNAQLK
ncbi:MAG: alpha/beta hydrolase family protein [Candidatus Levyibacteriota bacterium]